MSSSNSNSSKCYLIPFVFFVVLWITSEISTVPAETDIDWAEWESVDGNNRQHDSEIDLKQTNTATCKCGAGVPRLNITKIVGGVSSKNHGWPWMAVVVTGAGALCGGSLINNWYVLTAAHCLVNLNTTQVASTRIALGGNRIRVNSSKRVILGVAPNGISVHPKYNSTSLQNDIALIKLSKSVNYTSKISPICLGQTGFPFVGRNALVTGWGRTNETSAAGFSNALREAKVVIISNKVCNASYPNIIKPSHICTYKPKHDACQGDSGGPLIVLKSFSGTGNSSTNGTSSGVNYFTQVGVVAFGRGCAERGSPGVYTRVQRYTNWIKSITKEATYCSDSFS